MTARPPPSGPADGDGETLRMPSEKATLVDRLAGSESARVVGLGADAEALLASPDRYDVVATLGAGGMGEVRLLHDRRIGREVAMKLIHKDQGSFGDAKQRFLREARVQGQLEHPAIVPVYDLGVGVDGPYFTMKRIRGLTLEDVVVALAAGETDAVAAFPLRRLLTAMSTVCLAVAFAHARGVLHRDLKPANVMIGAFGEVHVLDWGLAKLVGDTDIPTRRGAPAPGDSAKTAVGEVMGTPGYMAPEQATGDWDRVDERSDVYALGAILFELLTLEPLHPGRSVPEIIGSTLRGADARARIRAPLRAIPQELESLCVRATALDPAERFASARDLAEAIDRFLDGSLDEERRRSMADSHAHLAAEAAALALGTGAEEARRRGMREAGAALALNPAHPAALRTLLDLLVTPPKDMPPEARAELEEKRRLVERSAARGPLTLYAGWLGFIPIVLVLGVRSVELLVVGIVITVAAAGAALAAYRFGAGPSAKLAVYLLGSLVLFVAATILGPLIIVPNLALTNALSFVLYGERRHRTLAIVTASLGVVLPFAGQLAGLFPRSYAFSPEGMTILPRMASLPETGTLTLLLFASLALVVAPSFFAGKVRDEVTLAEERAFLHAWNLRQALPGPARDAEASGSSPASGSS